MMARIAHEDHDHPNTATARLACRREHARAVIELLDMRDRDREEYPPGSHLAVGHQRAIEDRHYLLLLLVAHTAADSQPEEYDHSRAKEDMRNGGEA
jgi:hypothetical protein